MKSDPCIQSLIPPATDDEKRLLEKSLLSEGCRDQLVAWKEEGILLDGHTRFEICQREQIPYRVCEISFPDRESAEIWVIENQFGRRNLTPFQRAELALRLEPLLREQARKRQAATQFKPEPERTGEDAEPAPEEPETSAPQNSAEPESEPGETREKLAASAGVSHDTISKVRRILEEGDDDLKDSVRSGDTTIHAAWKRLERQSKPEPPREPKETREKHVPRTHEEVVFIERTKAGLIRLRIRGDRQRREIVLFDEDRGVLESIPEPDFILAAKGLDEGLPEDPRTIPVPSSMPGFPEFDEL